VKRLAVALIRLRTTLQKLEARWAVIGGLAVSARAEPRTTRDLDVSVAVGNDEEAEQLVREMWGQGYQMLTPPLEHLETARMATARLLVPGAEARGIVTDLLFASSGIEEEIVAAAEPLEVLQGVVVPVAMIGHLLALKVLAGRPQDLGDVDMLLRYADESDIQSAREALLLISRRGFDRGKELLAELSRAMRAASGGGMSRGLR
jgi:hypothetical protein